MHTECAVPAGTNFPKGKLKVFLFYFLYFTKSRKKAAVRRRKDLSLFVRSFCLCVLIRGLQNLESPCEGERIVTFCVVQKVTKKHAGQALRPAIQSSAGNTFGEASDGTCRNRFFAQNGGEKALNRCDVPALQRKDLERRLKEQRHSLVDSRLWLDGNGRWRVKKGCFGGKHGKVYAN